MNLRRQGSLTDAMSAIAATMRSIIGVPDYERYLEHMRRRHPAETPMRLEEFEQMRLTDKYLRPGARCC